jgi:hypothetical protein
MSIAWMVPAKTKSNLDISVWQKNLKILMAHETLELQFMLGEFPKDLEEENNVFYLRL